MWRGGGVGVVGELYSIVWGVGWLVAFWWGFRMVFDGIINGFH